MAVIVKLLVVAVGLLFMVSDTTQLSVNHPLHTVLERINANNGPFLGLVISSNRDEKILKSSTYFEPDSSVPFIIVAGRKFNFGKFNGEPAVYVLAGSPMANVAVTVQLMFDNLPIKGIISYGAAATVSNQVFIADVVVPSQVAFTSVWKWEKYDESDNMDTTTLNIGEYNVPKAGENYLGQIEFKKTQMFTPTSSKKSVYWFDVHSEWVQLASQINFGIQSNVHIGGDYRIGSSDIHLSNVAFATFLNKQLNVTAVDTTSAAVVSASIANGVPHIVFRGTSKRPGTQSDSELSETTGKNVLKAVAAFVGNLSPKTYTNVY